jgi:hypothetical protein
LQTLVYNNFIYKNPAFASWVGVPFRIFKGAFLVLLSKCPF